MTLPMSVRFNARRVSRLVAYVFSILCAAQVAWVGIAIAHENDPEQIKQIVQQEVSRLLTTEGALDDVIEQGITQFILKQREHAAQAEPPQLKVEMARAVDPKRDHILGNPKAAITLVEYSDFECPFCKRFHPTVIQLMANNPGKLRWVYRHFPLEFHNPAAQKQAEATECIAELGGDAAFWKYTNFIYQRTGANGNGFSLTKLRPLAEEIGVDGDAFDDCMASGRMVARVNEDTENGTAVGVSGTPSSFLVNQHGETRSIVGALPIAQLQNMVDELLQ